MAAGFRTRKVHSEASIGDTLKRLRTRQKLTVAQVEEATKIRSKCITALESDSWDSIPNSEAYGRGYLETYASFLKANTSDLLAKYDRSKAVYHRTTSGPVELAPRSRLHKAGFLLTPRLLLIAMGIASVALFTGVIGYQLNRYVSAPFLELTSSARAEGLISEQLSIGSQTYSLQGKTSVGATVTINGEQVPVDSEGVFTGTVSVQRGVNAIVVEALSTNGKKTTETVSVLVK
jgi:cytoskeletal protein RodZ